MGLLRTLSDSGTIKCLVTDDKGKAVKPASRSTTWKWLARSASGYVRIRWIHGRAAEACG
ncbi:unnamed protein product [Gulo gulo]|uniref:Uncharacterized protein n=1 Tax=Gulo gulo TaxID=48420 RepID=A0A9X9LHV0_GULGU|nr:unnamed protein product [Gulo gulo]